MQCRAMITDITERKRFEREMASGIAHPPIDHEPCP
jgi:hypothetical protein